MSTFGWKSPLPLKFGGKGKALVQSIYDTVRNNRPEALRGGGDATEVEAENRMIARMIAVGWRDTERRLAQADPRRLCDRKRPVKFPDGTTENLSMLERWERILVIRPRPEDSVTARRQAIHARLRGYASCSLADVSGAMGAIFGDWFQGVFENDITDVHYAGKPSPGNVHAYWATGAFTFSSDYPGEYDATKPWTTGLAIINVAFQPPAATPQDQIDAAVNQALDVLDDMLPAWMSGVITQWAPGQTSAGFFLGVSYLGLTAL